MKKLLLLLFLIPNLVMGEELLLICDVDKTSAGKVFSGKDFTQKDTIAIQVRDEYIRVDKEVYFKGSKFNKVGNYISYYRLEDDEISWGGESDETKQGHIRKTEGYINRLSGEIDFDILKFNTQYEVVYGQFIKGKCAKKERAF